MIVQSMKSTETDESRDGAKKKPECVGCGSYLVTSSVPCSDGLHTGLPDGETTIPTPPELPMLRQRLFCW